MRRKRDGFTFIEILVSMAIIAIISGVVVGILSSSQRTWQVEQARMTTSTELRRAIDSLSRELISTQLADLTEIPVGAAWYSGNLIFRIPQDGPDAGTTVLNDATGLIEWSTPITYSLGGNGGNQILRSQNGVDQVLANGVTALQFRRQAATPSVIEINVSVQRGANSGDFPNAGTLSTRVRVRN
ncbi:MAG: type II secretion system protein [Candidatus Omnitrophica bacterium]|nr:type II secretion system protein [Candidatus Omnitrophota bacterium]